MKKLLLISILFLAVNFSYAQTVMYAHLDTTSNGTYYTGYISKDGFEYKIGDKIKIGFPKTGNLFSFITEGDGVMLPITPLTSNSSGTETEIKKIWVSGNKRAGHTVSFRTKGITGVSNYTIQYENALETGEIKGNGLSSDEALAELKKAKDKLDLGLITQEEYDKQKAELSKFIK